jgi:hypothetical protein
MLLTSRAIRFTKRVRKPVEVVFLVLARVAAALLHAQVEPHSILAAVRMNTTVLSIPMAAKREGKWHSVITRLLLHHHHLLLHHLLHHHHLQKIHAHSME